MGNIPIDDGDEFTEEEVAADEAHAQRKAAVQDKLDAPSVMRIIATPDVVNGQSLFSRFMQLPREQRFMIGDRVKNPGEWIGEVRSIFLSKGGQVMYVVEWEEEDLTRELSVHRPDYIQLRKPR